MNPFNRKFIFKFAEKLPKVYFALAMVLACVGIGLLLIFPYLLLSLPFSLFDSISQVLSAESWNMELLIEPAILFGLIIISAAFTWSLTRVKYALPPGIEVSEKTFPHLLQLVTSTQEEFDCKNLHRVILRDKYEIKIVKTPVYGMPFLSKNTLIIGLPVLLSHSPLYFRVLLARRIGQLSAKHTPISTWLYFLSDFWNQFRAGAHKSSNLFAKGYGLIFKLYAPLYQRMMMPLFQEEELEADRYSMDVVNNQDMVEAIVYEEVVTRFLENKFWPKINQIARRSKQPEFTPYAQMSKVVRNGITSEELSKTIQEILSEPTLSISPVPSLRKRLNHMGHAKPSAPKKMQKSAAEQLLGQNMEKMIQLFDKQWLKRLSQKRKAG